MTVKECWAHIAACTRECNWDGVAARARELAMLGETADADGLLWAVKSNSVPLCGSQTFRGWPPRPNEDHRVWWDFILRGPDGRIETSWATPRCLSWHGTPDADIIKGWETILAARASRIEYYGGLVTVPAAPVVS